VRKFIIALPLICALGQVAAQEETVEIPVLPKAFNPLLFNYSAPTAFLNPFSSNWNTDSTKNRFEIDAGFDGNSNGISQQFVWNILFGSDFDQKTKDKMRGIMRPPIHLRGMSRPPNPNLPPNLLLSLRALIGTSARAEVILCLVLDKPSS
jgi:hypothetical protein